MVRLDARNYVRAMSTVTVRDVLDVESALRSAIASGKPMEIVGRGSKRQIGQPTSLDILDLSLLAGVTYYEPGELIVSTWSGTPLTEVISLIESCNQQLAFEPINFAALLGVSEYGTVGGMIAAGLAGPRRIKAGGVRDHLLGAQAVSGFGESFKTGGKVMKNVTGYDLCKLLTGSWGTLAVIVEATLKVMPKAESQRTLVLRDLDDLLANRAMTAALCSAFEVSAAAHLPPSAYRSRGNELDDIAAEGGALTLFRLEGAGASTAHRAASLGQLLKSFKPAEILDDTASAALWRSIRDVRPFAMNGAIGAWQVWRIVCPPATGGALGRQLARDTCGEVIYDWGGGQIWLAAPPAPDAHTPLVRQQTEAAKGHATLIRATEEVRRGVAVFPPLSTGLASLSERIRSGFDPAGILNRGRLSGSVAI
jgi:glycolate oxidase FAD binding subunit